MKFVENSSGVKWPVTSLPWRWKQHVSSKCWWIYTSLHGIASQNTVIFVRSPQIWQSRSRLTNRHDFCVFGQNVWYRPRWFLFSSTMNRNLSRNNDIKQIFVNSSLITPKGWCVLPPSFRTHLKSLRSQPSGKRHSVVCLIDTNVLQNPVLFSHNPSTLKKEAEGSSEMLVFIYQSTWCLIPGDFNRNIYIRTNLEFHRR
jgi:hypothetical protein